jgi:hypothetical protein
VERSHGFGSAALTPCSTGNKDGRAVAYRAETEDGSQKSEITRSTDKAFGRNTVRDRWRAIRLPSSGCYANFDPNRLCSSRRETSPVFRIQYIVNRIHSPYTAISDSEFHLVFPTNSFSRFTKLSEFSDKTLQNHFHLGNIHIHSNRIGLPPRSVVRGDAYESNDFQCSRFRKWTHDGRCGRAQRYSKAEVQQSFSSRGERQIGNVVETEPGRSSGEQCGGNDLQESAC